MTRPRWNKVISDLWSNKIRSVLVMASIAVGLFAIGIIATLYIVLDEDMALGYAAVNPANITVSAGPFDQDLVDRVRNLEGVRQAEGVWKTRLRLEASPGEWITIELQAIPDISEMAISEMPINRLELEQGVWPPDERQIVIERYKLADTNAQVGDEVTIELPSGKTRRLKLVGVVHDQTVGAGQIGGGFFVAPVQGYLTGEARSWLEQPEMFNTLYVTVDGDPSDLDHIQAVAGRVRDAVEEAGVEVASQFSRSSYEHPNAMYVDAIAGVLFLLGLLVVFLSGFLITNTLSALLNQQVQQIGVMKTVGARRSQIAGVYMALIFVFGVVAFSLAAPLAYLVAFWMADFLTGTINFVLRGQRVIPAVFVLQAALALIVPQVAALPPILSGTRISVQEALSGLSQSSPPKQGWLDARIAGLRGISRPLLISLRNAFRRKGRLLMTLLTLTLGGAIFIATFNVQISLDNYVDQVARYYLADVNLTLDRPYRTEEIEKLLAGVPGAARVEGWAFARSELLEEGEIAGEGIQLLAPPAGSPLVEPILISGRWVRPGDRSAIALSERFLSRYPDLEPGDTLRLRVNGEESDWVVVGFFQLAGKSGGHLAYTNYEYLSEFTNQPGKAQIFRVVSGRDGLAPAEQEALGRRVEARLEEAGVGIVEVTSGSFLTGAASDGLNTLTVFLLFMATLTALVGSIGLSGTMSMNVMERTREIGVMRAIGASNGILMKMVIVEGLFIGLISWLLASLLAFPISRVMSDTISQALFEAPSTLGFTPVGFIVWLVLGLALSVLASVMPARNAAALTIREVLAYE